MTIQGKDIPYSQYEKPQTDEAGIPFQGDSWASGQHVEGYRLFREDEKGYLHGPFQTPKQAEHQQAVYKDIPNVDPQGLGFYYHTDSRILEDYYFEYKGRLEKIPWTHPELDNNKYVVYRVVGETTDAPGDDAITGRIMNNLQTVGEPIISISFGEIRRYREDKMKKLEDSPFGKWLK